MKNNKLSFYFLVLLFSTVITSVMAQDVSIVSPYTFLPGPVDATKGSPFGGLYTDTSTPGTKRLLVAMVMVEDGIATNVGAVPSAVTYGGQPMTKVAEAHRNDPTLTDTYLGMFILNEAGLQAASGSNVVVTWSEDTVNSPGEVDCVIFGNVDQAQPIRAFSTGISPTHNVNSTALQTAAAFAANTGDMIVAAGATAGASAVCTWETSYTNNFTGPGGFGRATGATKAGSGADETPSFTVNSNQGRLVILGATLKKDGTPALSINDNQLAANTVSVYPNPASDILNIDSAVSSEKVITIINSLGQVVSTTKSSGNAQVDLKSLNVSGFVIVQVITNGTVSNHKVIVK